MTSSPFIDHTPSTAPAASRAALEGALKKFGHVPTPLARLAASPSAVLAFHQSLSHFDRSSLSAMEREVVVFAVATRNECHYCVALHTSLLASTGTAAELLSALREERPLTDPRLEALRRFTLAVLDTRGDVSDADRLAFFDAGFEARHALDVVVGIATYTLSTFANRLTRAPLDSLLEPHRWERARRST